MSRAGLSAGRHEAYRVSPPYCIEHRDVMDRHNSEHGVHTASLQELGDKVPDAVVPFQLAPLFCSLRSAAFNSLVLWTSRC
jgi:hypothetical protein